MSDIVNLYTKIEKLQGELRAFSYLLAERSISRLTEDEAVGYLRYLDEKIEEFADEADATQGPFHKAMAYAVKTYKEDCERCF